MTRQLRIDSYYDLLPNGGIAPEFLLKHESETMQRLTRNLIDTAIRKTVVAVLAVVGGGGDDDDDDDDGDGEKKKPKVNYITTQLE